MGKGFIVNGTTMQTVIDATERLLAPATINLGWIDIDKILLFDGEIVIAFGSGTGDARSIKACDDTLFSFQLAAGDGRRPVRALFRVTGPENLLLSEVNAIREKIEGLVGTTDRVTYGVAVDNRLDDELKIILLTRLEKERESSIIPKHYTPAEAGLVEEWTDKWLELIGLINEITGTEESHGSPLPPVEADELRYARLRFWFLSRQEQFVLLLRDFLSSLKGPDLQPGSGPDDCPKRYLENPYLYFYEPENLYRLVKQMGLQSGIDTWEPSELIAGMVRPVLIDMGKRMIEFSDWIDERV